MSKTVYTVGHSTRTLEEFITILHSFDIKMIADVRHYPGSRRYPYFNKASLEIELPAAGIEYIHIEALGGRRKPKPDSVNTAWRSESFRGYADYMETPPFKAGIKILEDEAAKTTLAFMCSEAVWWRCHRSLIADYLKLHGWTVLHIMSEGKATEHPYTGAATINNGKLSYADQALLF
jgi:uncharacterized protein (DUF488 family)